MSMYEEFIDCFPMDSCRNEQKKMLKGVADALESGKKYIIIEAPTGCGKSPVAVALCKYFGSGYICTDQKSLQKQYLRDFSDIAIQALGRSNFVCKDAVISGGSDEIYCNAGTCTIAKSYKCPGCPSPEEGGVILDDSRFAATSASRGNLYWKVGTDENQKCNYWKHKAKALNAEIAIHNYAYLLTEGNYIGDFGQRPVLVSDEGHNIEKHIMGFVTVSITSKILDALEIENFPYLENPKKEQIKYSQAELMPLWIDWLKTAYLKIPDRISGLTEIKDFVSDCSENRNLKPDEIPFNVPKDIEGKSKNEILVYIQNLIDELESLADTVMFFLGDCSENPHNWVIQPEQKPGEYVTKGEFKPVRIDKYAKDKYFKFGDVNVILSATILDADNMAKDLGILPGEYASIKIPPVFPKESNKLYHLKVCNLNYKNTDTAEKYKAQMLKAVESIDKIIDKFPENKGIIHCNTYKNMEFIKKNSRHSNRIMGHTSENRESVIKKHTESKIPSILCSPSMSEGVDLKFDSSRFQIIVKVPFPALGDLQIKERKRQDDKFYNNRTALYLIQALGRSVRDKEDWAYTFTIDSRFTYFCYSNRDIMQNFNRHLRPKQEIENFFN